MADVETHYWEEADWQALSDYVADKAAYLLANGTAPEIDHRYFEDMRKRMWLYEHHEAGWVDYSEETYAPTTPPYTDDLDDVEYYAGDWVVATDDPNYGWLVWKNHKDLTKGDSNFNLPPPVSIHPSDDEWITHNDYWQLAPNENKYHHWDENSLAYEHYTNSVTDVETNTVTYVHSSNAVSDFYPIQVDPKEQEPPVQFPNRVGWQQKEKVSYDKRFITQLHSPAE